MEDQQEQGRGGEKETNPNPTNNTPTPPDHPMPTPTPLSCAVLYAMARVRHRASHTRIPSRVASRIDHASSCCRDRRCRCSSIRPRRRRPRCAMHRAASVSHRSTASCRRHSTCMARHLYRYAIVTPIVMHSTVCMRVCIARAFATIPSRDVRRHWRGSAHGENGVPHARRDRALALLPMTRCRSRRCVHEPLPVVILWSKTRGRWFVQTSASSRGTREMLFGRMS